MLQAQYVTVCVYDTMVYLRSRFANFHLLQKYTKLADRSKLER